MWNRISLHTTGPRLRTRRHWYCVNLLTILLCLLLAQSSMPAQTPFSLTNGAGLTLTDGALFTLNGSLEIDAASNLTQQGDGRISLTGDWTNSGTFNAGNGEVEFHGSVAQTIGGNATTTFNQLLILKDAPGNLVNIDADFTVSGPFPITTGTLRFVNNFARTVTVQGDLSISATASLDVATAGNALSHQLEISGSLTNLNVLDLRPGGPATADLRLSGSGSVTLGGTGAVTRFNRITVDKNSLADVVDVAAADFDVPDNWLTIDGGLLHLAGAFSLSAEFFVNPAWTIPSTGGLWLDNSSVTAEGQNGDGTVAGLLRVSEGVFNVGDGANENSLLYDDGAQIEILGGEVNVAARFSGTSTADELTYEQSGGFLRVGTAARSTNGAFGMFDISSAASTFDWSGGEIVLQRVVDGSNGREEYVNFAGAGSVTGGVLRIDNQDQDNDRYDIQSAADVYELVMEANLNPRVRLDRNLSLLSDFTLAGDGGNRLIFANNDLRIGGDFVNNGNSANAVNEGNTSRIIFNGSGEQLIRGSNSNPTSLPEIQINKSGVGNVVLDMPVVALGHIRLISSHKLDIARHNLTLAAGINIYSDAATARVFNVDKNIFSAEGVNAGTLIRSVAQGASTPLDLRFPLGTPGAYTPGLVQFLNGGASFGANAEVQMRAVTQEHPAVELTNVSLEKYWTITTNAVTLNPRGATVQFEYVQSEVNGNEGSYVVLYFSPSWPQAGGFWQIDPGLSDDIVQFNFKLFYSQEVNALDGDWTAGEDDAGIAQYFSRIDGPYENPSTWSRSTFGGPPSSTIPNKLSDKVFIRNHEISVNADPAPAALIDIQSGSKITVNGDYAFTGDTLRLADNTEFVNAHSEGFALVGASGAVQTTIRDLSAAAVYRFNGTASPQSTGDGLPSPVQTIIVDKAVGDTLVLGKSIAISDSLVIENGVLDLAAFTVNGNSSGRSLKMRDGELLVRNTFPTNYSAPTFTNGRVTFGGTGNQTIPSSGSSPAVLQYNELAISGERGPTAAISLRPQGQIRIGALLDISELKFAGAASQRFLTDGSTVVFNAAGAQSIPTRPLAPADSLVYLNYYNLVTSGSGVKSLSSTGASTFVVLNNLEIQTNTTLESAGFDLEVRGDWENSGGVFDAGNNAVIFRSESLGENINIRSRSTVDNAFNTVLFDGLGAITPLDDMAIDNDLLMGTSATLNMTSSTLSLAGDWINTGGTFSAGNSQVVFNGAAQQKLRVSGHGQEFYDLTVDNGGAGLDARFIGAATDGLTIENSLILTGGNIDVGERHIWTKGSIVRGGGAPGHVVGELRKTVATGPQSIEYEVGYAAAYTPVILAVDGTGGSAGVVGIRSDTVIASSSPVSTGVAPAGSLLNDSRHVRRQWRISVPSGGSFSLGADRSYTAELNFLAGDARNGADPLLYESRLWNGTSWILPNRFENPAQGLRTATTIAFEGLTEFGTLTIGEPDAYSFYSLVDNGDWTNPASWSTQGYGGAPASIVPTANARIYIGDSKTIRLDAAATVNGELTIDSSGVFNADINVVTGTGTFSMDVESMLMCGNVGGLRAAAASGSIQTSVRNYNPASHNRGTFVYTGALASQITGDGLPGTVARLIIQKNAADVTLDNSVNVTDTCRIESGELVLGAALNLQGDLRATTNASITPQTSTVTFNGSTGQSIIASASNLSLFNLTVDKAINTGLLTLGTNSALTVNGSLRFETGNQAYIDARSNTDCNVIVPGSVVRAGIGHVDGNLQMSVGTGTQTVLFHVGQDENYVPFTFRLEGSGGTAGLVGVRNNPGRHTALNHFNTPIDPNRYVPRFWRVTTPQNSTFVRGNRTVTVTCQILDPADAGLIDAIACSEIGIHRGATEGWQSLRPNTAAANYAAGFGCGDTRLTLGNIDYDGSASTIVANDFPVDTLLGSTQVLTDGSTLLGDFVIGNQNSIAITTFYSRTDGDWCDVNTWSTVDHNGAPASRHPNTQYDVVFIAANHTVSMDCNIGTSWLYGGGATENAFYGPNVTVKKTGTLMLGPFELRGAALTVEKGGTLGVGSQDGIRSGFTGNGNVLTYTRAFLDSMNIVYTAEGYNASVGGDFSYCRPGWNSNTHWISRVRVRDNSTATIFDNSTNNFGNGLFYYADSVITMTAGQQYDMIFNPSTGSTKRWRVWIDFDRDGSFDDNSSERMVDFTGSGQQTSPDFTIPGGTLPGVARMRVQMREGTNTSGPCNGSTGEVEDYTVLIVNDAIQVTQQTGNGLPDILWAFEVDAQRTNPGTIQLGKNIDVADSLVLTRGTFEIGSNDIDLGGDWVNNNSTAALNTGTGEVTCVGFKQQEIRGSAATSFNDFSLNKDENTLEFATSATIGGTMTFDEDNLVLLGNDIELTFEPAATLSPGAGVFSKTRMFRSDGSTSAGIIIKQFSTAAGAKSFLFPIGIDTVYNPADLSITGTYGALPTIGVRLRDGLHPQRLQDDMLKKFWTVTTSDISAIVSNSLQFGYEDVDITGDVSSYLPAFYRGTGEWEINVGDNPKATPSPVVATDAPFVDGDWSAGGKLVFFTGRIFYSRQTGDWSNPENWSNIGHAGISASYYPFELYSNDTVMVDGHIITMDLDSVMVDSLRIGGPFNGTEALGRGIVRFGATPGLKHLVVSRNLDVEYDGIIDGDNSGARYDTLTITGNMRNVAQSGSSAGVYLNNSPTNNTVLRFSGGGNNTLSGDGVWGDVARVRMQKSNGLADTLINLSATFSEATGRASNYLFRPLAGVLRHATSGTLGLSYGNVSVTMSPNTAFDIQDGEIKSSGSLISNAATRIRLRGGDLRVGDGLNEHFLYRAGTIVRVEDGEFDVAGIFGRFNAGSTVQYEQSSGGTTRVLRQGNSDASRIGFDMVNSGSSFSMGGGRIIVANGTSGASADFRVDAGSGSGMTGGLIQTGDSTFTNTGIIKLAGSMPIYSLHAVSGGVKTRVTEETFVISNGVEVDNAHRLQLYGNTLEVGGDIVNYGLFDAVSGSDPSDARLLVLNGSSDQTIYNDDAGGLQTYNLRLSKSGGNLILGSGANSNLIVHNTLEFAVGNQALIDARSNARYVEHSPTTSSTLQLIRNGQGHVDGRLYRWVDAGARIVDFAVGTSASLSAYTPAVFETQGSGGTAGLVGVMANGSNHPHISTANVKLDNNIQRYWNVTTAGAFDLGASRTFRLTLQFINPDDLRNSPELLFFEQHRYTPACPDLPALCPSGGSWATLSTPTRTDTTMRSSGNTEFGDFLLAELNSTTFYSRQNGDWTDPTTWSITGYTGAVAPRIPDQSTDIVRIGNGKRVSLPGSIITPTIRSVLVEVFNNLPGELYIEGDLGTVRGLSFELQDSCTLGMHHLQGIAPLGDRGAIQTDTRIFGVGRYVFNSTAGSQNTGDALPDSVAAIIVDNNSTPFNSVFLSLPTGANPVGVRDTLLIEHGTFNCGRRSLHLYGDMILRNNGLFDPLDASVAFRGQIDRDLRLDNHGGVDFYDISIEGEDLLVKSDYVASSTAHVHVINTLTFSSSGNIRVRDADRYVEVQVPGNVLRVNNAGHVDGKMRKPAGAGADNIVFEVGNLDDYTPVEVQLAAGGGGVAGSVDVISYTPVPDEEWIGNRLDAAAKIDRYWSVTGATTFALGSRTANLTLGFPAAELASLTTTNSIIRRRSIPLETPEWSDRRNLEWNVGAANVRLSVGATPWPGLGEFYIGERAQRIFYSRSDGDWNNSTSWSFTGFAGAAVPAGVYPNHDWQLAPGQEYEVRDSVIIGGGHEILLNTQPEIAYLELTSNGVLRIGAGSFLTESPYGTSASIVRDDAVVNIAAAVGIESGTSAGVWRFSDAVRVFEPRADYVFSGSLDQFFGGAFPLAVNDILVDTDNNTRNVMLNRDGIDMSGDLTVQTGRLVFDNNDAFGSPADQALLVNGRLSVAGGAAFEVETSGTGPRTHSLSLRGDVNIDGEWLMRPVPNNSNFKAETIFSSTATQNLSGVGAVRLHGVTLDKGAPATPVVSSVDLGVSRIGSGDAINFINGTWEQRAGTLTMDDGVGQSRTQTIAATGALHITGSGSYVMGQDGSGASQVIDGGELLLNSSGAVVIGNFDGNSLRYTNTAGSRISVLNGTMTVAGRISPEVAVDTYLLDYYQAGGQVNVATVGHDNATLGSFDLRAPGSSFAMAAGKLLVRNANMSSAVGRPADVNILASTVNVTGGTIQFGDALSAAAQEFDIEVSNGAIWNLAVGSTSAVLHPLAAAGNLRIQADVLNDGRIDFTELRSAAAAPDAVMTFQGGGSDDQNVTGAGVTALQHMTMNRAAGSGVVHLGHDVSVAGILDLREGANSNQQVVELGSSANLTVQSSAVGAIVDAGTSAAPYRYVRTSLLSGRLHRAVTASGGNYLFPLGSFDGGADKYTPAEFAAAVAGADGSVGVRVSPGQKADGGHLHLSGGASDYIRRYWAIGDVSTGVSGQWTFHYLDGVDDITGDESNFATIARWNPVDEGGSGSWRLMSGATLNSGGNIFTSPAASAASEFEGDWTLGDVGAFRRIFYSLASGLWNIGSTWTFDPSHLGAPVGPGIFPDNPQDSIVIGGGTAGTGDHVVLLDTDRTIGGMTVGTSLSNTGTLDLADRSISGEWFQTTTGATLRIGSPQGIVASPVSSGNVRTANRLFSTEASYVYSGTTNQVLGDGLPATMASFTVENSGATGNNVVTLDRDLTVSEAMRLISGVLDAVTFGVGNAGGGEAVMTSNTLLRIGGSADFSTALPGFANYRIDIQNTVEYYGINQIVTAPPNGLDGYGNVDINLSGTKTVTLPVRARGDLRVQNGAILHILPGVNAFEVFGAVSNDATILNEGRLKIGS